jgi:ketosteroid isomerase-like protein
MAMFCDWLSCWQQHDPDQYPDYVGGRVISIEGSCGLNRSYVVDRDTGELSEQWAIAGSDEVEFNTAKFEAHKGSFETTVMIRMVGGKVEVRGNPSAYGRIDNLFGLSMDECFAIYNGILRKLGLPEFSGGVERKNFQKWNTVTESYEASYDGAHITRLDLTENNAVGLGNVSHYHRWLAQQKLYRSGPNDEQMESFARWNFDTVYTSVSKNWLNVKHYDKSAALEERTLPEYMKKLKAAHRDGKITRGDIFTLYKEAEDYLLKLAEWCAELGVTRHEISMRNRWFAQHQGLGWWIPGQTEDALTDVMEKEKEKIAMRAIVYQEQSYDNLTGAEYKALNQWKKGEDVKTLISKSTFYRLRSAILEKTGHDIAARPVANNNAADFRPVYFQVRPLSLQCAPAWYQRPSVPFQLAA